MTETTNVRCQAAPAVEVRVHRGLLAPTWKLIGPLSTVCDRPGQSSGSSGILGR